MSHTQIIRSLKSIANPKKVPIYMGFFKTGKGQYGEGDVFWGLTMPQVRSVAKEYMGASQKALEALVASPVHEVRMCGLVILTLQYEKGSVAEKKRIYDFYLHHTLYINNWDLVDVTCPRIVGDYLLKYVKIPQAKKILLRLATSKHLWERRIAMVSCYAFIRAGELDIPVFIAEKLLRDTHDLMHKAVGWMLREVGKKDVGALRKFLNKHAAEMPRTALRYAIERMGEVERKAYLKKQKIAIGAVV